MSAPIMPGAEPISIVNGSDGVLLVHGYAGTPREVSDLALVFAQAGFSVEVPLLPGHGTAFEEILTTTWTDYADAIDAAYQKLAAHCQNIVVGGLSLGGSLATWLVLQHPTIAGLISINGIFKLPDIVTREMISNVLANGILFFPVPGVSLKDPKQAAKLISYGKTPVAPMLSILEALEGIEVSLGEVRCPVLCFTSLLDRGSPNANRLLIKGVSGSVENVILERSEHVATLDFDKDILEAHALDFVQKLVQESPFQCAAAE